MINEQDVAPSWTIIGGRLGRHEAFLRRLFNGACVCFVALMVAAIVAYERLSGSVPWWRDLMFFTLGPAVVFAIVFAMFSLVARIHARVIGLTCASCGRTFTGTKSKEAAVRGRCPYCLRELEVAHYTKENAEQTVAAESSTTG